MISRNLQNILMGAGFRFRRLGEKYKNRFEVVYKAPFYWRAIEKDFDIEKNLKVEIYEESPSTTVCHYFPEYDKAQFINCVIDDIEKYILFLNEIIKKLKSERE